MNHTLEELPIELALYTSVKRDSAPLGSIKSNIGSTWRRSIRSVGGYWIGTAAWAGEPHEMLELFLTGIGMEVRETLGGLITWQGFIGEVRLTWDGIVYVRSWEQISNWVQAIYTRLGDNILANGSGETGVWGAFNTPTTLAQSTTWVTDGTYSIHIVSDAIDDGAYLDFTIVIVAGKAYDLSLDVKIVSGTWRLIVYRVDTSETIASVNESTVGQVVMRATVPDSNTFAGTIGILLFTTTASGEIYADNGSFRVAGVQARTNWYGSTDSQAEFGVIANALLLGGMTDDAANAVAQTELAKAAWPRTVPPDDFNMQWAVGDNRLEITVYGYAFTLRNLYTTYGGTSVTASTHVTNLIGESEFVDAGTIETNAMSYQIDERAPVRMWEVLRDITLAGSTAGARWTCGVYGNKLFDYQAAATTAANHFRSGKYLAAGGGTLEPWLVAPGLVVLDDMPVGPGDVSGNDADDPRVWFIEQVEFDVAQWLAGGDGLSFKAEASE